MNMSGTFPKGRLDFGMLNGQFYMKYHNIVSKSESFDCCVKEFVAEACAHTTLPFCVDLFDISAFDDFCHKLNIPYRIEKEFNRAIISFLDKVEGKVVYQGEGTCLARAFEKLLLEVELNRWDEMHFHALSHHLHDFRCQIYHDLCVDFGLSESDFV